MLRVAHVDDDVMHELAIALANLRELHVLVFGEVRRHGEIFVRYHAFGGYVVDFGHRKDNVWFADLPAFGIFRIRRQVFRIAFRRARIDPRDDSVDLFLRQAAVVREIAMFRVRKPGRHLASDNFFADRFGPGAHLFETHKRHGRDFAGAMTGLTVLLNDRRNVFVVRDGGRLVDRGDSRAENQKQTRR